MAIADNKTDAPKPKKKKITWPARRCLDMDNIDSVLQRNISRVTNVPAEFFDKHELDKAGILADLADIAVSVKEMKEIFGGLPADFPPKAGRGRKAREKFVVGARVQIRENKRVEYEGILEGHVNDEFEVCGDLRKNFLPIKHHKLKDSKFFLNKAHLFVVSGDECATESGES